MRINIYGRRGELSFESEVVCRRGFSNVGLAHVCAMSRRNFTGLTWSVISRLAGVNRLGRRRHEQKREFCTQEPQDIKELFMRHLTSRIKANGPLTVAEYMKEVLINPVTGYYINNEVFGHSGDYITSPEISQLFGELIGVWCVHEWQQMGKPDKIQIVELGPGRGTLAADMMSVFSQFKEFKKAVSLHLVEVSPNMRQHQSQILTGETTLDNKAAEEYQSQKTKYGPDVHWYRFLDQVPQECSCFIAHEFFDVLPIYKFQKKDGEWNEILVDIQEEGGLRFIMSRGPTTNSKAFLTHMEDSDEREHVEVSPESGSVVQKMSQRISDHGGRALIVDYGHEGTKTDTFRGFKDHKLYDPLEKPGSADLTADVDFAYLKHCCGDKVKTFGPVTQNNFLNGMGIGVRLQALLQNADDQTKKILLESVRRLMHPQEMGHAYKFMAIAPQSTDYVPPGFMPLTAHTEQKSR
ncbi:protein arginine methyltransferase NDUFAF7, mitochondrial-like [Saccostrea echinata]|uniref:protein arginine methyltransferase NDUFAF7, mitochondrial-like n=1 Tax=Saccostrea echinata TaxID=191078 RepID=UPI002A814A70|nr:protein arginine methyltransferase NDUFAF7, mitochondrial-like [Saccostrea echinata]